VLGWSERTANPSEVAARVARVARVAGVADVLAESDPLVRSMMPGSR